MKILRYTVLLLFLMPLLVSAQQFSITSIEQTPENLIVHYDLVDTTTDRMYSVYLYMIQDSGIEPLKRVSENVGFGIRPGSNRKIVWAAKEELGADFSGAIELEVRGKVYVPFIEFKGFPEDRVVRRGKPYTYVWQGQSRSKILNFDLYQDGELKYSLPEIANTGNTELILPKSVKTGRYNFIVSDSRNKDLSVESPTLIVKPKVPFLVKILPLVAVGASYPLWPIGPDENNDLEGPPPLPTL